MTSNLKAVPLRVFKRAAFDRTSDDLIKIMQAELESELEVLRGDIRDLGARRNGLAAIEKELMLRGIG